MSLNTDERTCQVSDFVADAERLELWKYLGGDRTQHAYRFSNKVSMLLATCDVHGPLFYKKAGDVMGCGPSRSQNIAIDGIIPYSPEEMLYYIDGIFHHSEHLDRSEFDATVTWLMLDELTKAPPSLVRFFVEVVNPLVDDLAKWRMHQPAPIMPGEGSDGYPFEVHQDVAMRYVRSLIHRGRAFKGRDELIQGYYKYIQALRKHPERHIRYVEDMMKEVLDTQRKLALRRARSRGAESPASSQPLQQGRSS